MTGFPERSDGRSPSAESAEHFSRRSLGYCHGYSVLALDGPAGEVETPIFPPDVAEPDYVIVRLGGRITPRLPIVHAGLVAGVDAESRSVRLAVTRDELARLPEHLPAAV